MRFSSGSIARAVMLLASAALVACGSSDDDAEPEVNRDQQFEEAWQWPAEAGESRDWAADHASCKSRAQSAEDGWPRFRSYLMCMQELGWEPKPKS